MKVVRVLFFIIIFALLILVGLSYAGLLPINIQDYFITTVDIDIYTNDQLVASDQISSINIPELRQGILPFNKIYGDFYGTFVKGECSINDKQGIFLYTTNSTGVILDENERVPQPKENILVKLYYKEEEPQPALDPEVEYGTITIQIDTDRPAQPYTSYAISLFGIKDTETVSQTYNFDENGLIIIQVDLSYAWIYYFEGAGWPITFDENKIFYDVVQVEEIPLTPEPLVIDELPEEHEVRLYWEYADAATDEVIKSEAAFSAYAGEPLDLEFYIYHPPGTSLLDEENIVLEFQGEIYKLVAISKTGGNVNSNWPLVDDAPMNEFPMINDDLIITFHYEKTQA